MRLRHASLRWFALILVLALVAAACGDDDVIDTTTTTAPDVTTTTAPDEPPPPPPASPGLDDCDVNPNTCNFGPRADGGTITVIINAVWDSWNHHTPEGGSVYAFQALEGLGSVTRGFGEFMPDGSWRWDMDYLAEEPTILSEDPLTLQFIIHPDAVWDDGTPLDADDVIFWWMYNNGRDCEDCRPRATTVLEDLVSVEAGETNKHVIITYPDDYADPEWYARYGPGSYPAHIAEAQGFDWKNNPEDLAAAGEYFNDTVPFYSSGPYLIESATLAERVVMVPNPMWWGEVQPTVDRIVKEFLGSPADWIPALRNLEIDGGSPATFTTDLVDQLGQEQGIYFALGSAGAVWEHVDMNMDNPFLADEVLRQAIFIAIDRSDARERIFGGLPSLPPYRNHHIFSQLSPYYTDLMAGTGYGSGDAAAALALLEGAGYTLEDGQLFTPDGTAVEPLRFSFLATNVNRELFVELTQSYLADIGITVEPFPTPPAEFGTVLFGQDYDMVIFGWSGSPLFASAPNQFWHSTSGSNFGKLNSPEIDAIVSIVASQFDIDDSAALATEASQLVLETAYVLPLWDTLNLTFVRDTLVNFRDNHNSSLRAFYNMAEWGILAS